MKVLLDNLVEIEAVFHIMLKNRYILLAFVLSIVCLIIICIKDKKVREYGIFCLVVIFLLLNPIFYMLIKKIYGSDGLNLYYFRFFYAIPFNITISFVLVYLLSKIKNKFSLVLFALFLAFLCLFGDSPITKDHVIISENNGKIPQYDYDIDKIFKEQNISGFKRVIVPLKTVTNIKQVNPEVLIVKTSGHQSEKIDNEVESSNADIEYVIKFADSTYCDYITLKTSDENIKNMSKHGYVVVGKAEDYSIFSNPTKDKNEYDCFGNIVLLNNTDDNDIKFIKIDRDDLGRIVKETPLDNNKNNIVFNGFSYLTKEYDKDGLLKRIDYYDRNNNLVNNDYGFSTILNEYEKGNLVLSTYYDKNSNICKTINGEQKVRYEYNKNGDIVSTEYLDSNDNLVDTNRGYTKIINNYDENGNLIKIDYLAANLTVSSDENGVSSILYNYENNKLSETKFVFDSNKDNMQGYNRIVHEYETAQKINRYYYDDVNSKVTYEIEMPIYVKDIYDYLLFDNSSDVIEICDE